tara:strand:- start:183 stop:515 length:333 start_codon:yes stop_codon:yes gene_type:complete
MYFIFGKDLHPKKNCFFNKKLLILYNFNFNWKKFSPRGKIIPLHIFGFGSTFQKSLKLLFQNKINFYYVDIYEFFKKEHYGLINIKKIEREKTDIFCSKNSENITTISIN